MFRNTHPSHPEPNTVYRHWLRTRCTSNGRGGVREPVFFVKFEPNELLPGLLRHHLHICFEALCAEPQFILCQAFARALPLLSTFLAARRSSLAGSPGKKPQRPPRSTWISKGNRLRIRGETSDKGRTARVGCWGWHLGSAGEPGQHHRCKTGNGSADPPWLACPRG